MQGKSRHKWELQQCVPSAAASQTPPGPRDVSKDLARQGDAELGCHLPGPEAQLSLWLLKEHLPSHYAA